jgi:mono/diheme cytochrome c family protein
MGSRGSWVWFCIAALVCTIACAQKKTPPVTAATPPAVAPATTATTTAAATSSDQLPDGAGRQILMSACTACHGLREVTKFRGFYVRQQWKDVVLTMVDYGAPVGEKDVEVLTDYLTENLGKKQQ